MEVSELFLNYLVYGVAALIAVYDPQQTPDVQALITRLIHNKPPVFWAISFCGLITFTPWYHRALPFAVLLYFVISKFKNIKIGLKMLREQSISNFEKTMQEIRKNQKKENRNL